MKIKLFNRAEHRKLKDVKAIIVHWDGGEVSELDALWRWMDEKSNNSYHYLVSKGRIIQTTDTDYRAIHCGHRTYTDKAVKYFGSSVCSMKDSPNNYTIGVCMLHDSVLGSYYTQTLDSGIQLINQLCIDFGLDPLTQILRHSDLTDEKATQCPRVFFENPELWCVFKCKIAMKVQEALK